MNAIEAIKKAYDYEDCKEIVSHGCESGVCFQHIYYGDTIKFFDTYEDEITERLQDTLGREVLSDIMSQHVDMTGFKNACTWTFIELVAGLVVDDMEDAVTDLEDVAESNGYNPSRSMTDTRYAQVCPHSSC